MASYVCSLCQVLLDNTPGAVKTVDYQNAWLLIFGNFLSCSVGKSSNYRTQIFLKGTKVWKKELTKACKTARDRQNNLFSATVSQDEIRREADYGSNEYKSFLGSFLDAVSNCDVISFVDFLGSIVGLSNSEKLVTVTELLNKAGIEFFPTPTCVRNFAMEFSAQFVDAVINGRQKPNESIQNKLPEYLSALRAVERTFCRNPGIEPSLLPHLKGYSSQRTDLLDDVSKKNISAIDELNNCLYDKRFVLLHAEGGIGKSKLLREYTYQMIKKTSDMDDTLVQLPLYYPLVDLNGKKLDNQLTLLDHISFYYNLNDEDRTQLHAAFNKHRHSFVLLLDGLNEVSTIEHQGWLIKQIEQLARIPVGPDYRFLFIILTCRTTTISCMVRMSNNPFTTYALELNEKQRDDFIIKKFGSPLLQRLKRNSSLYHALTPLYLQLYSKIPNNAELPTTITQLLYYRYHKLNVDGTEMSRPLPDEIQAMQMLSLYILLPALCDCLQRKQDLVLTQPDLLDSLDRLLELVKGSSILRGLMPTPFPVDGLASDKIVRYLVEDALLDVDTLKNNYAIHEQRRDYFAAYHQRNLCRLVRETTNEDTWQSTMALALKAGFSLYIDIAQRKVDTQALFAMILCADTPSEFDSFENAKQAILFRVSRISDADCVAPKTELLEELRIFITCLQNHPAFMLTQQEHMELYDFMHQCLAQLCAEKDSQERWTSDLSVQYQTRIMIENCEYIRHLREKERLNEGMLHAVALYKHKLFVQHMNRRLENTPLMFGFLNQAGKCVLRQEEDLSQNIAINGVITNETLNELKEVVCQEFESESSQTTRAQLLRRSIIKRIDGLKGAKVTDLELQYLLAQDLLTLSALHSSSESLNLLGMMHEQIDVRQGHVSVEQRQESIRQAFLLYYLSSRIPHPRVQPYAVQKVVELSLKEGICICEEPPKTISDSMSCFEDCSLKESPLTQKMLTDYLLLMESCGMPSTKALYGLYSAEMANTKLALDYLKDACKTSAPQLDVMVKYLSMSPSLSSEEIQMLQANGTSAIENLLLRTEGIRRADRWCPSPHYLNQIRHVLETSETTACKQFKKVFDECFPVRTSEILVNEFSCKVRS